MLRLSSDIEIGNFRFRQVHSVEIESSYDTLTDTCTIEFPRKVEWKGRNLATGGDPLIKREDRVIVRLGYDDNNVDVFNGIVRDLSAELPVRVQCEDQMYLLKKGNITLAFESVGLSELLSEIINIPFQTTIERTFNQLRINNATPAKVLSLLRDKFQIHSWFREGKLYSGLAVVANLSKRHKIHFNRNIISNDLEFRRSIDVKIKLKGIIVMPDNSRKEITVGSDGGGERTFHYYNQSEEEVRTALESELERLKYDGYRGSFETFGIPLIKHGDVIELIDPKFPEREMSVFVKKVIYRFGLNGFRQIIELEGKA